MIKVKVEVRKWIDGNTEGPYLNTYEVNIRGWGSNAGKLARKEFNLDNNVSLHYKRVK